MPSHDDTIKRYMQYIVRYPLLTPADEAELAARVADGEAEPWANLVRSNLRLVVKIAHDFKGRGVPLLDLISEGNIGLMRAAAKFDPSKGAKLSSYAAWWIKQSMRRALADQGRTIRIPVQSAAKISRIQTARAQLTEELGREPTDGEIAAALGLQERTVGDLRLGRTTTVSLQAPIQSGEQGELRDIIPDDKAVAPDTIMEGEEALARILMLIHMLDDREHTILWLRFGLDGEGTRTLAEISQTIGRSRERVRQLQKQALKKLRLMIEEDRGLPEEADPAETPSGSGYA